MTMFVFRSFRNPVSPIVALSLGIALAGCTNNPLTPFDDDGVVRSTTRAVGLSPKPVQAPGFVEQTRKEELEYVPVGVTPPARTPLNNPKVMEADLAAKRAANEASAAAPRPASPYAGKIEPGYRAPEPAPIPAGPELKIPGAAATPAAAPAAKAAPKPAGPAAQSTATHRKETAEQRKARRQRAATQSGETN